MNNEPPQNVQGHVRQLLTRLPDAPMPSNFTARVMQAIDLEEKRQSRSWFFGWSWRAVIPRAAVAAVIVGFASFTFQEHQLVLRQEQMARSAALVASQPLPSVDALKNFDAIQRMSQPARPDEDLLALASDMQ
jgi:hypothetical protein